MSDLIRLQTRVEVALSALEDRDDLDIPEDIIPVLETAEAALERLQSVLMAVVAKREGGKALMVEEVEF
jgi:hypothetical protein